MRIWMKRSFLFLLLILFVASLLIIHTLYFRPLNLSLLYLRSSVLQALDTPETLSRMRLLDNLGMAFYRSKLDDYSGLKEDKKYARAKQNLANFESYDVANLRGQDKLSAQIFAYNQTMEIEGERWRWHDFPVNQMFGVQSSLPNFMSDIHQVKSLAEGRDYVARLNLFSTALGQVLSGLQKRAAVGVLPPRFTVEKVLAQMQAFAAAEPRKNMLYLSLQEKLSKAEKISAQEKEKLLQEAELAIKQSVLPGFQALIAYHQEILSKTTSNDGVWRLPDGQAYYAFQVRRHTTTDMQPEQVHQLGLQEVQRLRQEMEDILQAQGLKEGSLQQRVDLISKRPDQMYANSDEGRAQILQDYQKIIDQIDAGLKPMFNIRPSSNVVVRRVPEFAEKTAPGAYYEFPALDGSRPGTFYANLRKPEDIPKFSMRTLAYHEAIPGHHFQVALQMQMQDLPLFRRFSMFTAYAEGWALYAERLAWEAGFQSQPLDNLGRLQAEMFRAVRLVVDTGLHHKRWSREQAIAYMVDNTGMAQGEVTAEIERYLVSPGQALAYKIGMLKILQLRDDAKQALGSKFDLRQFHDVVLKNGAMPLAILDKAVQEWVAQQKIK